MQYLRPQERTAILRAISETLRTIATWVGPESSFSQREKLGHLYGMADLIRAAVIDLFLSARFDDAPKSTS